jgi:transcriptional regulator with XRE-family HTH domain
MSLAERLREARKEVGLTLDQLSEESGLSKTYLWELENDKESQKKPSADTLIKLVTPLRTTIADLLGRPTVQVAEQKVEISDSLQEFCKWMEKTERKLSKIEIQDLATMRFRGGQPKNVDDWDDLYRTLKRTTKR